jgi:hypothetical protein
MHPGLTIFEGDGLLADTKSGANTIWVEAAA